MQGWDCNHCVAKSCYYTSVSMIVSRFTLFTKNFVIRSDQITKMFRSVHDCTSTSSARSPCNFRPQADVAISVFREVSIDIVLSRTRFHFCSRLHLQFMRRTGSVSIRGAWFPCGCQGQRSSTIFSMKSCSQFLKSRHGSLCTSSRPSFFFLFPVPVGSYSGFPRSSSPRTSTSFGCGIFRSNHTVYLLTSNTESCDEDFEEVGVGVAEELVDKLGTTSGT